MDAVIGSRVNTVPAHAAEIGRAAGCIGAALNRGAETGNQASARQ